MPEINQTISKNEDFRIFAIQNPFKEKGRKGLPYSFLNRFTKLFIDDMKSEDLYPLLVDLFPKLKERTIKAIITFNVGV